MRVGQGYDVHRLVAGRPLILGGVQIPFPQGLLGHSDADVLCHAIADALLGAAAAGDIGQHFPNSDPQWKGVSSLLILRRVADIVSDAGFVIMNVDATVVAERPMLAAYTAQMRENIASALRVSPSRVSVKATTTEGLGMAGRGEGIAASAVALIASASGQAASTGHAG
ncbi:MAG: 2-C-methyl-D-erythritol 2,4-cyclodiphosphate synthase [Calditrichaeota bacterium]|nr:2-C-methyl-D-erythritol 2,4-cyclodiphosphate synthase [Calditrichota bacterium]